MRQKNPRLKRGFEFRIGPALFGGDGVGVFDFAAIDHVATCGAFKNTSRFTLTVTQVVQFGATNAATTNDFDLIDAVREQWENALDAFAIGNFANDERCVDAVTGTGDTDAFIYLNALTVTFGHFYVYFQRITGS